MRRFAKTKAFLLVLLTLVAVSSVMPSIARIVKFEVPEWIASTFTRTFELGLDLQGGLHLEYSVAVDEAVENKLDRIAAELEAAFREKKSVDVAIERVGIEGLVIRFPNPDDIATATDDVLGIAFGSLVQADPRPGEDGIIRLELSQDAIAEDRKAIVGQALDTVRRRVDAMGIAEPNIYPKNRQVVVELPGLSNATTELKAAASDAGARLEELLRAAGGGREMTIVESREDPGALSLRVAGGDARALIESTFSGQMIDAEGGGRVIIDPRLGAELQMVAADAGTPDLEVCQLALTEAARDLVLEQSSDFRRLLRVIERAAVLEMHLVDDEFAWPEGTEKPWLRSLYEAGFVTEGMGIAVNLEPDYGRPEAGGVTIKEPFGFYAKDRETLERFFASLPAMWRLPATHKVAYGRTPIVTRRNTEPEYLWRTHILRARADITGERIVNATVGYKQDTGTPQVEVKFDRIGATAFDVMSGENVGRKMAIIMDDMVVSDPIFNERIAGGNVVISLGNAPGESVREQANDLVKVLKSGSLPARLHKEFEIRVGADLGKESVEGGFRAFVVGLALVVGFMAIYYRKAGVVACLALTMNVILLLAAMAFFRATLTLPGIAGMVLTLGMAVDANVIINERIRELLREGYTARAAIEAGYNRAFSTILDSQLTTAIAGVVLWQFGSGPIRGFAITLLIGIATSIFTAVFATRVFFDIQANRRGFDKVSI